MKSNAANQNQLSLSDLSSSFTSFSSDPKTKSVQEALQKRGRIVVEVQGRSMFPILRNGTHVEVRPVVYDELRPGDLIVFSNGYRLVCHRLIRKRRTLLMLKGDTNLYMDPPVIQSQILGRVARLISDLDNDWHIHPMDTPKYRRRARSLARFTYPYALYFNLLHWCGSCRWWARGIEMEGDHRGQ